MNRTSQAFLASAVVAAVLLAGGTILIERGHMSPGENAGAGNGNGIQGAAIGGPFTLVNSSGQTVTDKAYAGKWLLVYFGYTFCPDACPTTLNNMAQALAKLGPNAQKIVPLFITVDPKRDTPKVVGDYVKSFDPRIVGLSGSPAEIAAVAKEYHIYYAAQSESGGSYLVDHSSFVYLMTPRGRLAKVIPGSETGTVMANEIAPILGSTS